METNSGASPARSRLIFPSTHMAFLLSGTGRFILPENIRVRTPNVIRIQLESMYQPIFLRSPETYPPDHWGEYGRNSLYLLALFLPRYPALYACDPLRVRRNPSYALLARPFRDPYHNRSRRDDKPLLDNLPSLSVPLIHRPQYLTT